MHILCVGISHHTAPVSLRERLAVGRAEIGAMLTDMRDRYPQTELAILSTCNRTELYLARPLHGHPRIEQIVEDLAARAGCESQQLMPAIYHYDNERAIRHLYRVTSGLDSMVMGESQIVSQVKDAYDAAQATETAGKAIHRMFQMALATSKRVRSETGVGAGRLSVASVAVQFAGHLFETIAGKCVLAIGAGEMTELALRHFRAEGAGDTVITSRTLEHAQTLAKSVEGRAEPYDQLEDLLIDADVIISSTGATEPIVTTAQLKKVMKRRKFRPLFVIDLAVPRDFAPGTGDLANVYLFNLDDLEQVATTNANERQSVLSDAETIVEQAVGETYALVQTGDAGDLIRRLRRQMHNLGREESNRTIRKLMAAEEEEFEKILDEHTHRLINKILHRPVSEMSRGGSKQAALYATALRRLFDAEAEDLEVPESTASDRPAPRGPESR